MESAAASLLNSTTNIHSTNGNSASSNFVVNVVDNRATTTRNTSLDGCASTSFVPTSKHPTYTDSTGKIVGIIPDIRHMDGYRIQNDGRVGNSIVQLPKQSYMLFPQPAPISFIGDCNIAPGNLAVGMQGQSEMFSADKNSDLESEDAKSKNRRAKKTPKRLGNGKGQGQGQGQAGVNANPAGPAVSLPELQLHENEISLVPVTENFIPGVDFLNTFPQNNVANNQLAGNQKFGCYLCGKQFENAALFELHKKVHLQVGGNLFHAGQNQFPGGQLSSYEEGNVAAYNISHQENPANRNVNVTGQLGNINTTSPTARPFRCNLCNRSFLKKANLNTHVRIHFRQKVLCPICNGIFETKVILKKHMLVHSEEKSHICDVCNSAFRRVQDLTRHKVVHDKNYACEVCGRIFSRIVHLDNHRLTHQSEMMPSPPTQVKFRNTSDVLAELKENTDLFSFGAMGNSSIPGNSNSNGTEKKKRGRKPKNQTTAENGVDKISQSYQCLECGKTFKSSFYLNTHLRTHTGEKPFTCKLCRKSFTQLSSLQTHSRIHTGVKPYQCTTCGKKFSVRLYLQAHIRTHTGEKPFICRTCGRGFTQPSSLTAHEKVHEKYRYLEREEKKIDFLNVVT